MFCLSCGDFLIFCRASSVYSVSKLHIGNVRKCHRLVAMQRVLGGHIPTELWCCRLPGLCSGPLRGFDRLAQLLRLRNRQVFVSRTTLLHGLHSRKLRRSNRIGHVHSLYCRLLLRSRRECVRAVFVRYISNGFGIGELYKLYRRDFFRG